MNGPEHYRRAEALLKAADELGSRPPSTNGATLRAGLDILIAEAQVHATLASAAATIETAAARGPGDVSQVWVEAVLR